MKSPSTIRVVVTSALALVFVAGGCTSRRSQPSWTPTPRVGWSDLTTAPITPIHEGYVLLGQAGSVGRFPASIGVTRVAIKERDQARTPVLPGKPKNEFLTSLNKPDQYILAIVEFLDDGGHRAHHVREPFRREPDFGVDQCELRSWRVAGAGGAADTRAALRAGLKSGASKEPLNSRLAEANCGVLCCTMLSLIEGQKSLMVSFQK